MKNLKLLGLAALVSTALMAFASGASATIVTTTTGGPAATPPIHLANENGYVVVRTAIANALCHYTAEFTPTSHGGFSGTTGPVSVMTFSGCTNGWHVTAVPGSLGQISIHSSGFGENGSVRWHGGKVTLTRFGVTCVFETNNTLIGTLTGGNPATLNVEGSLPINESESSALCGSGSSSFEGSLVTTSALYVAP